MMSKVKELFRSAVIYFCYGYGYCMGCIHGYFDGLKARIRG